MWTFLKDVNLLRYLFVWRVNHTMVFAPDYLPMQLSPVLGDVIAERLPTNQARAWQKALAPWAEYDVLDVSQKGAKKLTSLPDIAWPLPAVLLSYPGKESYGQGELIFWELKLLGTAADHGVFLELILPAVEAAGQLMGASKWRQPKRLWGRFDVQAVYAARGGRWEPLAQDGRLDLNAHPLPHQWAEGLFTADASPAGKTLNWLTPYAPRQEKKANGHASAKRLAQLNAPSLAELIEALLARLHEVMNGRAPAPGSEWDILDEETRTAVQSALAAVDENPAQTKQINATPKGAPGLLTGAQTFAEIPPTLVPLLELASILHIGRYTHLGCGTFYLS